jgi:hypothetical protein
MITKSSKFNSNKILKMGRSSKPRKTYRPLLERKSKALRQQPWLLDQLFAPVEELLNLVGRRGELEVTTSGALVFRSISAGRTYEAVAFLMAQAEIFHVMHLRDVACPDSGPLRVAAAMLNVGQLTETHIVQAKACLAKTRAYLAARPVAELSDAAQSVSLRFHMDTAERRAPSTRHK